MGRGKNFLSSFVSRGFGKLLAMVRRGRSCLGGRSVEEREEETKFWGSVFQKDTGRAAERQMSKVVFTLP